MISTPAAAGLGRTIATIPTKVYRRVRGAVQQWRCAIAEVRIHQARIEAELYRNRCRLRTKNDDDLPIMP